MSPKVCCARYTANLGVVLLFIMPLLTMRLFAEEKKQGTIELLLTYPVRDLAAVLAKFAACLAVYTVMLALTAVYPVLLIIFAQPEVGPILAGYLGLFLLGAAFIALGALASSLTRIRSSPLPSALGFCCSSGSSAGRRNSPAAASEGCFHISPYWNISIVFPRGSSIPKM